MIIQKRDGSLVEEPIPYRLSPEHDRLYVEIDPDEVDQQANLVARLINLAFDALGARHLEVHVLSDKH